MPTKSKFPGYDLVANDEPFKVGDYYYASSYENISGGSLFNIGMWSKIGVDLGPNREGQSFSQRHAVVGYTVIRKATKIKGLPVRLELHRTFSTPLPLP